MIKEKSINYEISSENVSIPVEVFNDGTVTLTSNSGGTFMFKKSRPNMLRKIANIMLEAADIAERVAFSKREREMVFLNRKKDISFNF